MNGKTDFRISVKRRGDYILYVESQADFNSPRVYQGENDIVIEIYVDGFDYEMKNKDGAVIITAKECE